MRVHSSGAAGPSRTRSDQNRTIMTVVTATKRRGDARAAADEGGCRPRWRAQWWRRAGRGRRPGRVPAGASRAVQPPHQRVVGIAPLRPNARRPRAVPHGVGHHPTAGCDHEAGVVQPERQVGVLPIRAREALVESGDRSRALRRTAMSAVIQAACSRAMTPRSLSVGRRSAGNGTVTVPQLAAVPGPHRRRSASEVLEPLGRGLDVVVDERDPLGGRRRQPGVACRGRDPLVTGPFDVEVNDRTVGRGSGRSACRSVVHHDDTRGAAGRRRARSSSATRCLSDGRPTVGTTTSNDDGHAKNRPRLHEERSEREHVDRGRAEALERLAWGGPPSGGRPC
jgi:hypothetical protein